jgi:hypothetical protein
MEPVFIFLAIIIFAVVRGATRGQRQRPGIDPFDRPHDVTGDTNERVVEAQERALEALRRWEARQGLGGRPDDAARPRFGDHREATRPAPIRRERREAYAEIAQLLEPNRRASRSIPRRQPVSRKQEADGLVPSAAAPVERPRRVRNAAPDPVAQSAARGSRSPARSPLARLEGLPLAARAIVYAELLRPPRAR